MATSRSPMQATVLLTGIGIGFAAVIAFPCWVLLTHLPANGTESIRMVLTSVATVGGVASGLSLAGYSVALSGTRGMQALREQYGSAVKLVLLGGYVLMVLSSMACAVASGFTYSETTRAVAAASTGIITSGLVITALLINSMFGWNRYSEYLDRTPGSPHPPGKSTHRI